MEYNVDIVEDVDRKLQQRMEVGDILMGLEPEYRDVINKRYYYNMTMTEIGNSNGYSRETARRRLKKALKICKKNLVN